MFGVVLWSDDRERRAVIWCEDHGDLAYYRYPGAELCLVPGDWVQFDISSNESHRRAYNARLVAEGIFSELPGQLLNSETVELPKATEVSGPHNVVALRIPLTQRDSGAAPSQGPVKHRA